MLDVLHLFCYCFLLNLNAFFPGESVLEFVVVGIVLKRCFIVKLSVLQFLVCSLLCSDVALLSCL